MDLQQVQRQIRSTDVEQVLLLAHAEGGQTKPSQIKEEISDESGGFATAEASQQLRDLGLARQETSLAGEVTLTGDGKRLAERIQQSRLNGPDRRAAVQRGILQWLNHTVEVRSTEEYVDTESATAWGVPFAEQEVERETSWLQENGFIEGVRIEEAGDLVLHPRITNRGRDALDHDGTPFEFLYGGGGSVTHDNSNNVAFGDNATVGGFQNAGQGNSQTNHQTINHDERKQVLAQIDQILSDFDAASDDANARASVEVIRAEAQQPTTTREKLRAMVMPAMVTAGASEAVRQGLVQLFTMLS